MHLSLTGFAHVRLTVTDIAVSRKFYDDVFGLPVAVEVPDGADEAAREELWFVFGGVIYQLPGGSLLGLRPVAQQGDRFEEDRVGLDHLSFAVDTREQLESAAGRLDDLGIAHGEIKDAGTAFLLEFRDPDNIALELYSPKG